MKNRFLPGLILIALALVLLPHAVFSEPKADAAETGQMLSHNVFFKLNESDDASREALINACHKLLSGHPGVVFYAAGSLAGEFDRGVNVRDFDVALHLVFADRAAHDAYQEHPRHNQFIEENRETWAEVRVFDSWVAGAPKSE